ncbi:hypothetical protein AB0B50_00115 [Streptomyces sp. NPDC041068]|uniref:hypothetical protein n=1 Tax=Streptomyces sp. NPDC041068 TaxID=3155130 RepID=UPI0033FED8EA
MSPRSTMRPIRYTVTSHPDGERTMSADCMSPDCKWSLCPTADVDAGEDALRRHRAETGHALFNRRLEDMACVTLADRAEQERRAEVHDLELAAKPWAGKVYEARVRHKERAAEHARAEES